MKSLRKQVWEQVSEQVWEQVRGQVWEQVWGQVWEQVWDQVWMPVSVQVSEQVWEQVRDEVEGTGSILIQDTLGRIRTNPDKFRKHFTDYDEYFGLGS